MSYQRLFLILLSLFVLACSGRYRGSTSEGHKPTLDELRQTGNVLEMEIAKTDIAQRWEGPSWKNKIRLVEIYRPGTSKTPEYRILDVQPGSVYEAMGLQNGDILVDVEGITVRDRRKFPIYARMLPNLKESYLRVRRDEQLVVLHYQVS